MHRRVALAVLAAALVTAPARGPGAPAATPATAAAPAAPPTDAAALLPHTRSYYMANAGLDAATKLGCDNGDTQGRATLFFGAPVETQGSFGTTLWGGADSTARQSGELVKAFVRGYAQCRQVPSQQLLLGMGTSNSTIDRRNDLWVYGHGAEWARVVREVADWADAQFPGVALVFGAWDAEPSWSAARKADLWAQGYSSVGGHRPVHANFSADGCPRDSAANGPCANGWRQHEVWRLAWQWDPALPIPQVYATSGVNAHQWQKIDEYGATAQHDGMTFSGVMSQHAACLQVGGCHLIDNTPEAAHRFLRQALDSHPLTRQPTLEAPTDMHWHR